MKELLNYYYYILTDRINMKNHDYYFIYRNNYFAFYRYSGSLEKTRELFNLNTYMIYNGYKVNKIILNKNGEILTSYGNNYYVLVLLTYHGKNLISLKDIMEFNQGTSNLNLLDHSNWYSLWSLKIDNIEYSINHLRLKYKLLYSSIYYYIGLSENAISYLKYLNLDNKNKCISHKRVLANSTIVDFYNPLNLIIDYRIRDLTEYFKSCFFNKTCTVLDIINSFKKIKMSEIDYLYFYVRMLFPSYYFDLYDQILSGMQDEKSILKITSMQEEYEYLLYEIYLVIKSKFNLVGIEWINKKFIN